MLYLYGNNPEHFDLIYIAALCISCLFCWQDKDTLGALLILLGFWCLSRILYFIPENTASLVLVYIFCVFAAGMCRKQMAGKIVLLITVVCICVEVYWQYLAYPDKPQIYYYLGLLAIIVITRTLLFNRVILLAKYFDYISGKIALDWQIRGILLAYFTLVLLMVFEYLLRHLGGFHDQTLVYYQYTFTANVISTITLTTIFMHFFHNQAQKHLKA